MTSGRGRPAFSAKAEEPLFELAARKSDAQVPVGQDRPDRPDPSPVWVAVCDVREGERVGMALVFGLVDGPLDEPPRDDGRQIEECARDGRYRNGTYGGHLVGGRTGDSWICERPTAGRVDRASPRGTGTTAGPRASAAARWLSTASGPAARAAVMSAIIRQDRMADGVDAAVDRCGAALRPADARRSVARSRSEEAASVRSRHAGGRQAPRSAGRPNEITDLATYLVPDQRLYRGTTGSVASKSARGCSVRDESPPLYCGFWTFTADFDF